MSMLRRCHPRGNNGSAERSRWHKSACLQLAQHLLGLGHEPPPLGPGT